jgi:carotene biosynthesis associated membrane protein
MSIPAWLFVAHLFALAFGLVGILIMLPHPELWTGDPNAVQVFDFSMKYAGSIHIILGAATMLAFGLTSIGWRKTLVFATAACSISLSSELIGTGTGWPFGNYEYTSFLGHKVLGRVPYTIPLSWFYMGLASYLLGSVIASRFEVRQRALVSLGLGVWFLTVWDLVLDPAMAHESLLIKFWVWDEAGGYFGMPIKNFIGWSLTGLVFMGASRLLWRSEPKLDVSHIRLPLAVYVVNLAFAMILSAGVDLWLPILITALLALAPAALVAARRPRTAALRLRWAEDG